MEEKNTAPGNVYVFNVNSQDLDLSLNGKDIDPGTISGWANSGATKYQPNVAPVPRTLNASEGRGKFFNGNNALSLQWIDGLFFAQVRVDGSVLPLNQDVLLFIEKNKWQMVNQFAVEVGSGDVLPAAFFKQAQEAALAQS